MLEATLGGSTGRLPPAKRHHLVLDKERTDRGADGQAGKGLHHEGVANRCGKIDTASQAHQDPQGQLARSRPQYRAHQAHE